MGFKISIKRAEPRIAFEGNGCRLNRVRKLNGLLNEEPAVVRETSV